MQPLPLWKDIVRAIFMSVPLVVSLIFLWAAINITRQLGRIEARLDEIRDRLPRASASAD